jgi:hypothetical protein
MLARISPAISSRMSVFVREDHMQIRALDIKCISQWTLCLVFVVFVFANIVAFLDAVFQILRFFITEFAPIDWIILIR